MATISQSPLSPRERGGVTLFVFRLAVDMGSSDEGERCADMGSFPPHHITK